MAIQQISSQAATTSQAAAATPRPAAPRAPAPEVAPLFPERPAAQPSAEQVQEAVVEVRKAVQPVARNLRFSIDDDTGKTIISVVDSVTNEVIRQIPGEEIVAIAKAIDRMKGLLLHQKA